MDFDDLKKYGEFGFHKNYVEDPNDIMSIFNARKRVLIEPDSLPLHKQIKLKRIHDGLSQEQLGKIVRLPASTVSLIERGERLIMKNRYREFERYLYEELYQDGELILTLDQDAPDEPLDMTIEEQRAFWKAITDNDPDLWGTIL
jgi:transcriptional regulator with XRE-family HTH domain